MAIDFDNLSPAQARVAIASDVITRLDAQRIFAINGAYVKNAYRGECQACALGAMFVCSVAPDVWQGIQGKSATTQGPPIRAELGRYFNTLQLQMIECAHERDYSFYAFLDHEDDYPEEIQLAVRFGKQFGYGDDEARLRAICSNIIENNGEFVP